MRAGKKRSATGKKKALREPPAAGVASPGRPDPRTPLQKLSRYCVCGATLEIAVVPRIAEQIEEAWRRVHSGPRHRSTSAAVRDPLRHTDEILADVAEAAKAAPKRPGGDL